MVSAMADIFKVPQTMRHNLKCYNFKSHRYMKGDMRSKARKTLNFALDQIQNTVESQRSKRSPDKQKNSRSSNVDDK